MLPSLLCPEGFRVAEEKYEEKEERHVYTTLGAGHHTFGYEIAKHSGRAVSRQGELRTEQ